MDADDFDAVAFDWKRALAEKAERALAENRYQVEAWLDVNDRHPELFGDAILLRDDDGMGFALDLTAWRGKHVRVTIEEVPTTQECLWRDRH